MQPPRACRIGVPRSSPQYTGVVRKRIIGTMVRASVGLLDVALLSSLALAVPTLAVAQSPIGFVPKDPWGGSCTIDRLDAPGRSMQYMPLPYEQKVANCFAEAAATIYSAQAGVRYFRASPLAAALTYTNIQESRWIDSRAKASHKRSIVDYGVTARTYQLLGLSACSWAEVEAPLESHARAAVNRLPPKQRPPVSDKVYEFYRSSVNLLFEFGQRAVRAGETGELTPARADQLAGQLIGEWTRRKLPPELLPSRAQLRTRFSLEEGSSRSRNGLNFAAGALNDACSSGPSPQVKPESVLVLSREGRVPASIGRYVPHRNMAPEDWALLEAHLRSGGSNRLPLAVSLCAASFEDPNKDYVGKCPRGSLHAVVIKGVSACPGKKRWFLLQNSWGKDWCPDQADPKRAQRFARRQADFAAVLGSSSRKPPPAELICDQRADGRFTGSVWVTEEFMKRTVFSVEVFGGVSAFERSTHPPSQRKTNAGSGL